MLTPTNTLIIFTKNARGVVAIARKIGGNRAKLGKAIRNLARRIKNLTKHGLNLDENTPLEITKGKYRGEKVDIKQLSQKKRITKKDLELVDALREDVLLSNSYAYNYEKGITQSGLEIKRDLKANNKTWKDFESQQELDLQNTINTDELIQNLMNTISETHHKDTARILNEAIRRAARAKGSDAYYEVIKEAENNGAGINAIVKYYAPEEATMYAGELLQLLGMDAQDAIDAIQDEIDSQEEFDYFESDIGYELEDFE